MRSILEKAIVHLLNEEQAAAEALFHQFMVEKARKIHESLRSGEVTLSEGWDDEITSEEYMTEDDLESIEDDHDAEHDDMDAEASDELADDMDVDAEDDDEEAEDADAEAEEDDADAESDDMEAEEEEGDTDERLADLEDQIEKLTAEFDQMMAEIDSDDELEDDDMGHDHEDFDTEEELGDEDMGDEHPDDMGDEHMDMGDHEDVADRMEDDVSDKDYDSHDEMAESDEMDMGDDMHDMHEGKMPPWLKKGTKKPAKKVKESEKKPVKTKKPAKKDEVCEADDKGDEDEDLTDITESVMAELEKISVSMSDGQEIGAGKKITTNDKSPMVQADVDKRGGAQPVKTGLGPTHQGFERETTPPVKAGMKAKNTVSGKADSAWTKVPDKGDKSAKINSDFAKDAGKSNKSVID